MVKFHAQRKRRKGIGNKLLASGMVTVVAASASVLGMPSAAASTDNGKRCIDTNNRVRLTPNETAKYNVHGKLCMPSQASPKQVQLLVGGGTYNHTYWDFPYKPEKYSYVRHMANSGHATWNVDRLGTGNSSHPPGTRLTMHSQAFVIHQLVQKLRHGSVSGKPVQKIITVGHSLGSGIVRPEAAKYHDVDGVIITGMDHSPTLVSATGLPGFAELVYPARLDPNKRLKDRDPTYLTTIPGLRGGPLFYNNPTFLKRRNVDPKVVNVDEQTKDTVTVSELTTFFGETIHGSTSKINVPVLVAMGSKDGPFCGKIAAVDCSTAASLRANEKKYYRNVPSLETYTLKNSGHDINLHRNAKDWFQFATSWLNRHFGR